MPGQSSISRGGVCDRKAKAIEPSVWEDNLRPGCEVMRSLPWILVTDSSFPAVDRPCLYCGVSEGSCVASKPVLVAWALQTPEHADKVKRGKHPSGYHLAVLGQALSPSKSITVLFNGQHLALHFSQNKEAVMCTQPAK